MRDRKFIYMGLAVVLVLAVLLAGFSGSLYPQKTVSAKSLNSPDTSVLKGPADYIEIDFTYDKENGCISVGGFSCEQIQEMLGFQPLDKRVLSILSEFGDLHMQITGTEANISLMDGTHLATVLWDEERTETVLTILGNYGVNLDRNVVGSAQDMLTFMDLNVNLRSSSKTSEPLKVALASLILADVAKNGDLSLNGNNTGFTIGPEAVRILEMGKIENIFACWDKGTLHTEVNNGKLPSITLSEEGLEVADKALGFNLGDILPPLADTIISSRLGASMTVADGEPAENVYCGDED